MTVILGAGASGGIHLSKGIESIGFGDLGALSDERGEDQVPIGIAEVFHTPPVFLVVFEPADKDSEHLQVGVQPRVVLSLSDDRHDFIDAVNAEDGSLTCYEDTVTGHKGTGENKLRGRGSVDNDVIVVILDECKSIFQDILLGGVAGEFLLKSSQGESGCDEIDTIPFRVKNPR